MLVLQDWTRQLTGRVYHSMLWGKLLPQLWQIYVPHWETLPSLPGIFGGSESGTSERLAQFILRDLRATSGSKKLLYLTGDKNRDTLPNILKAGGLELQPLQVYETQGSSTFAQDLKIAIDEIPLGSSRWWIVYFAPSAADFVAPTLRDHFDLPSLDAPPAITSAKDLPRIAAIGLQLPPAIKLHIDVTPPKPTADSLASAIAAWESEHAARP
ncbi:Uroporphyrinogen-III synthase [Grifola frondosa]|uniref:Uroporphyrinogen-III synthase n=1 Tax=Grifola frondosa TaxID=5627 RepID=A0A1C7ME88_GRIFR|nr:Uroporphyrinogen-III synthase [Grifola frondosa]